MHKQTKSIVVIASLLLVVGSVLIGSGVAMKGGVWDFRTSVQEATSDFTFGEYSIRDGNNQFANWNIRD